MNKELYELLKKTTNKNGLPIMNSSHFQRVTRIYGKEVFRKTLAEYLKVERPQYPLKEFDKEKVVKIFQKLVSTNWTKYIGVPSKEVIEKFE